MTLPPTVSILTFKNRFELVTLTEVLTTLVITLFWNKAQNRVFMPK